jgi:hypothetical protein
VATGLYTLFVQATPEPSQCGVPFDGDLPPAVITLAFWQGTVLTTIESWWDSNSNNARSTLNILAGDFVGDTDPDCECPIVQTAIDLAQGAQAPSSA